MMWFRNREDLVFAKNKTLNQQPGILRARQGNGDFILSFLCLLRHVVEIDLKLHAIRTMGMHALA